MLLTQMWVICLILWSSLAVEGQSNRDLVIEMMREQRIALIIGNGGYEFAPLRNPVNDARAMANALRACDFRVSEKIDCDKREMYEAIREFGEKIRRGGVGLFYYAGHGMQIKGRNYLVPVDVDVQREDEVQFECIDASLVLQKMESAENRANIVILDACRNNPFARSSRSGTRGLARMDAATGSILAYATAPGQVAADGEGSNGLYTSSLLKYMRMPGLKIEEVFKSVRQEVVTASKKSQIPWESSSLIGDFYFVLPQEGEYVASPPPPSPPPQPLKGHLQISVNAPGSKVYVNDTYHGVANPDEPLNLRSVGLGRVAVKIESKGYESVTKSFTLQANQWTRAEFKQKKIKKKAKASLPPTF